MNVDILKRFPNQNREHRLNSCIGEAITDSVGNEYGQPMDPDYTMATSYYVQGKVANILGTNLYAAMLGAIAYGCLPDSNDRSDPLQTSELYENDIAHYTDEQKAMALRFVPPSGLPQRLSNYDEIVLYLNQYKMGVPLVIEWHPEFDDPNLSRILTMPTTPKESNHCVIAYEVTTKGLEVKPFLGEEYGYAYIPKNVLNKILSESYGFVPGNRTLTLLYIMLWRISIYLSTMNNV